ncbi:MAG TPA: hypothetical protein VMT96_00755 [Candidatus Bathyarchaeia archaeon]|nr:hypothetical protein [Candidatus Bathyarchaeia archaeon]
MGCVTYDATGAGNAVNSGSNSVNITWNHIVASGSNRVLMVGVMVGGIASAASTFTRTCTYGGTPMTYVGSLDNTNNGNNGFVDVYYLAAPTAGTATVSYTVSKSSTTFGRVAGNSVSYLNASQSVPTAGLNIAPVSAINPSQSTVQWSSASVYYIAGCMMFGVLSVDSSRTITSIVVNNALLNGVTFPNQGTTRWTSNSGSTSGQTSVAITDAPGMQYNSWTCTASGTAFNLGLIVVINPAGATTPKGIQGCWLTMIGAGGGGGSGRRGASLSARAGGDGGGGGAFVPQRYIPANALGSTYSVYVPPVASGGAAQTVNDTNGNSGTRAPDVMFSSGNLTISCGSGHGGNGGGTATSSGADGGLDGDGSGWGAAGGVGSAGAGGTASSGYWGNHATTAGGGAGGGFAVSNNTALNGGAGGDFRMLGLTGGAGGVAGGASPGAGSAATAGIPGGGAGGGASNGSGVGQSGASATAYGAGGGGGGASLDGNNSGAGGNGGPGYVRVMWDYR